MEGSTANRADLRGRVIVCTTDGDLDRRLRVGLENSGFDISTTGSCGEAAAELAPGQPAVVLIDDQGPGWLRVVMDVLHANPDVRPVVLTAGENVDECLAAIIAGVVGFCRRDASTEAIVRTVQSVYDSGVAIPRGMMAPLVDQVRHGRGHRVQTAAGSIDVTDREWEILHLMMQRRSTKEMADALFVSVGTVRSHVSSLLNKMGAVDRDDAIAMIERARRA